MRDDTLPFKHADSRNPARGLTSARFQEQVFRNLKPMGHGLLNEVKMAPETANSWKEKRKKRARYPVEHFDYQIEADSTSWKERADWTGDNVANL